MIIVFKIIFKNKHKLLPLAFDRENQPQKSIQNRYKSIQIDDKITVPKRTKCAKTVRKQVENSI